mmetsp:Transcript_7169/g.21332  ORF Transcript_7169/g.21332 Transcript_7169/m.21332 type:complete len:353 (-) Transcript_7169:322-1380(-)
MSASGRDSADPPLSPPRTPPSGVSYVAPKRPPSGAGSVRPLPDSISVLTWNVWFGRHRQTDRYSAIVAEVLRRDVDVACFQEVTAPFVAALTSSRDVRDKYDLSPSVIRQYGVLTIAKKSLGATFEELDLPTRMGRTLIVAWLTAARSSVDDEDGVPAALAVGNVHLESLDSETLRRDQLRSANAVLNGEDFASILCGDFNFDSTRTWGDWRRPPGEEDPPARKTPEELENAVLGREMPDWDDAWPTIRGADDPGLTFDGETNPVCVRDRLERMRYDRIMVKRGKALEVGKGGDDSALRFPGLLMEDIAMVGTENLDTTGLKASDHYGLLINLKLGRIAAAEAAGEDRQRRN